MTDTATIEALEAAIARAEDECPNAPYVPVKIELAKQAASTIRALSAENERMRGADIKSTVRVAASTRRQAYEECAAICEAQKQEFLSEQYAVGQPISSIRERFACTQIEEAIRAKLDALPAQSKRNRDDCL